MRKVPTVLMTSTLILSSIFTSVVYATENMKQESPSNVNVQSISETNHASEQTPEAEAGAVENDDVYASGTAGTCDWYITNEGVLHIGSGELTTLGSSTSFGIWGDYSSKLNKIVFDGPVTSRPELDYLFWRLENVTEIVGLDFLDISGATRTRGMFGHMKSLKSLDVSHFDTSNVWLMSSMFENIGVESLDISSLDTSNATQLSSLVSNCPNLKKLNAASISLANDVGVYSLFAYNNALEEVDLSSLDLSYVNESTGDLLYRSPIKKLITSEKTRLNNKLELNIPPTNDIYTGKWQTVGIGTDAFPKGTWSGTTEELYERTQEGNADTYVWQPVLDQAEDVTIKYLDEDNKPIADDIVKTGSVGEDYTSEQIEIPGYTFKEVQGNPTGQFSDQAQTVVYIYIKNTVIPVTGSVIVKYEDDKGNTLSDSVIKSGTVGENYTTEKKDIKDHFLKETRGDISGIFTDETQTIIYVYSKENLETEENDNTNNNLDMNNKEKGNTEISGSEEISINRTDKINSNKKENPEANTQRLPQTGEQASIWTLISGLVLLVVGLYTALLRFKVRN